MKMKYANILGVILSSICLVIRGDVVQDGILTRMNTTVDALLTQTGPGTFNEMQRIIVAYGQYAHQKDTEIIKSLSSKDISFYNNLLRDGAYLLEGFFAHCGMLLGLPLFAGIDTTPSQVIDPKLFFQLGAVKPQVPQVFQDAISAPNPRDGAPVPITSVGNDQPGSTVAQVCGMLFHASRYMRIITNSLNAKASVQVNPADLCAGVIVINNGWVCSLTMPSVNSSFVQQKGNLFCLPAGISVQDFNGNILGFIKNHTVDFVPFSEGIDQWSLFNNVRLMKLVVSDDVGSAAFVATQLGNAKNPITLQIGKDGKIILNDPQGNNLSTVNVTDAVKKFYSTLSGPWAVIIEMDNKDFNQGDLFPTLQIKGLVKLNYCDFPLQIQASQSQKIGYPFSVQSLITAPQQLMEEVRLLSQYTKATIENNFTYGSCKEYVMNINLPTFKRNSLYAEPINTAYAKMSGILKYDWETKKYTIQDALQGITKLLSGLFFKRHNMTPSYMLHAMGKDSNILLV